MKTLLRSVILIHPSDSEKEALDNIGHLLTSGLTFESEEAQKVWEVVRIFYLSHNHVPAIHSVRAQLERLKDTSSVDYLEQVLLGEKMISRGDFVSHLVNVSEDRKTVKTLDLARKMVEIASQGIIVKDGRNETSLRGATDACRFFSEHAGEIMIPVLGGKSSGNAMKDGKRSLDRYARIKSDPGFGVGQYCGVEQIDKASRGIQPKKLWVHGAYPGHLKSAFGFQWAYNQAIYYGESSHFYALEMAYEEEILPILLAMHSAHEDFGEVRQVLGIQGLGLDCGKILYGELNAREEEFLTKFVVPDFNKEATVAHDQPYSLNPLDYGDIIFEAEDPDRRYMVSEIKAKSEMVYHQIPFKTIFVDYAGLLKPAQRYANRTDGDNEIIRDLKKLAVGFNKGAGIGVVAFWQISRSGFDAAKKNDGIYSMTSFSYANEVERSADILTTSWFDDDLRLVNRAYFQNLKSRHGRPFERISVRVEPEVKRILTDRSSIEEVHHEIETRKGESSPTASSRLFGGQPDIEPPNVTEEEP